MKKVLLLMLMLVVATFSVCQSAAAYSYNPHDNAVVHENYFGLAEAFLGSALGSPSDHSWGGQMVAVDTPNFTYLGLQMFQGEMGKHAFWGGPPMSRWNKWDPGSLISFRLLEGENGEWSFLSLTLFSSLPLDDPRYDAFEQRVELLLTTLTEYFNGGDGNDPDPPAVPVPTPLLLLASGLVGFVGLRRMSKR